MKEIGYEEGKQLLRDYVCAECGFPLRLPWGGAFGIDGHVIMCGQNPDHQGFTKPLSYSRALAEGIAVPPYIANNIERKRRQEMAQKLGNDATTTLEPYRGITSLSQATASMILQTIWPSAPPMEVFKAALVCHQYGLNPLMKHLYLIEFKTKEGSKWERVLGIGATRLIASRGGAYGYVDGPRMMTKDEQESIRGYFDEENVWAITVIQDSTGNKAPGYGNWPKGKVPYGADKGNTGPNMAMIRSERNAFERLRPGEMPPDMEVMDIDFLEAPAAEKAKHPPAASKAAITERPGAPSDKASQDKVTAIYAIAGTLGVKNDDLFAGLQQKFGVEDPKELTNEQAIEVIHDLKKSQEQLPLD